MRFSTVSFGRSSISIALVVRILTGCEGGGSGGDGGQGPTYSISGAIKAPSGTAKVEVRVSLAGSKSAETTTDVNGSDLPAGKRRIEQKSTGIAATIVAGQVIVRNGSHTGAMPGRLVRKNHLAA